MAINFPSNDLMTLLGANPERYGIERCEFDLKYSHEFSGLQSGDIIVKEFVPPRWRAAISTTIVEYKYWKKIKARLNSLAGSLRTLYLWDTIAEYPEEDPDGSILAASTPTIQSLGGDNRSLRITGLPANYVLREGDRFSFVRDDGRIGYHEVAEDTEASGAGLTPEFEVSPFIRDGANINDPITLIKAPALMRILPGTIKAPNEGATVGRIFFEAIQVV